MSAESVDRMLRVFLCHASGDKPAVRDLGHRLACSIVDPWLDEERLIPGQDWELEVRKAVRSSDAVLVCLSRASIAKNGYVQKEISNALDAAERQPEGSIFLVPVRLEECEIPERLRRWQWVDLFEPVGYARLLAALQVRAESLGLRGQGTRGIQARSRLTTQLRAEINSTGMFEFLEPSRRFDSIGNMERLKRWLRQRGKSFTESAFPKTPLRSKGLLIVGVPGCGKSAIAMATATEWGLPLIRLCLGTMFGPYLGQSEANFRQGIDFANRLAPCIVLIDELDVRVTGYGFREGDGVSTRLLNTLLTWIQEHNNPLFVIATANDATRLPPEALRKGRFDDVFFVDLPDASARREILAISLQQSRLDPRGYDLGQHAASTEGFVGVDLEQVVSAAIYDAYSEHPAATVTDRHISTAVSSMTPLSRSLGPEIELLRAEALKRGWSVA